MKPSLQLLCFQLGSMANIAKNDIRQRQKKGEEITPFDFDYFKNINNALTSVRNCRKIKEHVANLKAQQPSPPPTQSTNLVVQSDKVDSTEEE